MLATAEAGTNVNEVAESICRISTPRHGDIVPGGTFTQYLVVAATEPLTLACMHGSAWRGDGAELLLALADAVQ